MNKLSEHQKQLILSVRKGQRGISRNDVSGVVAQSLVKRHLLHSVKDRFVLTDKGKDVYNELKKANKPTITKDRECCVCLSPFNKQAAIRFPVLDVKGNLIHIGICSKCYKDGMRFDREGNVVKVKTS